MKRFYNGKKCNLFHPYWSIISWSQTLKLKFIISTVKLVSKCTCLINNSTVPNSLQCFYRQAFLIFFNEKVISNIINALNNNKTDGHDDTSIRMIKLCSKSVVKPLFIKFKNCIDTGTFPDISKRYKIIPVYKKGDKQIVIDYRPVSLLPILGET